MRTPLVVSLAAGLALAAQLVAGQGKTIQAPLVPPTSRRLASDFELRDGNGQPVRLSDSRGSVVLLDFWATRCGGCVEEIPHFIEIASAYRAKGLRTIGVAEDIIYENLSGADQAWQQVKPFVRDHKMTYPVVLDDRDVHRAYNITALPLTYLLDRQGRIAASYGGVVDRRNVEANIATLLQERR